MAFMQGPYRVMDVWSHNIPIDENGFPSIISIYAATPHQNSIQQADSHNGDQVNPSLNDAASATPSRDHLQ